jgi:hypothetical protein
MQQLHTDQGRQFEAALFQQVCDLLQIKKTRTTPFHPQSDGQTERLNRTLEDILAKLCAEHSADWDEMLPFALAAYRSSVHSTTGETPNRMMLGREVITPLTLLAPSPPLQEEKDPWVDTMHQRFRDTHAIVQEYIRTSQRTTKSYVDRRSKNFLFEAGDEVWLLDPVQTKGVSAKLEAHRWTGPWRIEKKFSSCVYLIKRQEARKGRIVNVDRLVPYVRRDKERFPVGILEPEVNEEEHEDVEDKEPPDKDDTQNLEEAGDKEESRTTEEDVITQVVTRRAQRVRRKPARFQDYVEDYE